MSVLYKIFESFGEPCDTCRIVLAVLLDIGVCLANRAHIPQLLTIVDNDQPLAPSDRCVPILKNKSLCFIYHNTPSLQCNASKYSHIIRCRTPYSHLVVLMNCQNYS